MMLSFVIPAYNEAESLPDLLAELRAVVKKQKYQAEVIFINDGSTDATAWVLDAFTTTAALVIHVIHFRRNRGKAAALTAGFQKPLATLLSRSSNTSLYGNLHRYIPILSDATGFSVGGVKVRHQPRRFGNSKYGFKRIPKGLYDLLAVLFLTKYRGGLRLEREVSYHN